MRKTKAPQLGLVPHLVEHPHARDLSKGTKATKAGRGGIVLKGGSVPAAEKIVSIFEPMRLWRGYSSFHAYVWASVVSTNLRT